MADIAGLAIGAVSIASLFTTCIECFDIVVAGKNFSEDYEQLCALFSLQRTRFGLWGESVGLIPNPTDGKQLRYDKNIDRPDIRPEIGRILNNIRLLLQEAGRVDEKYGLKSDTLRGNAVSASRGMQVFKSSFEMFKSRIKEKQKQTSAWKVTQWAIHDANKFEGMVDRLERFVDGLESITKSLGLLEQQHARLREEIDDITDTESLRLLRDAASSHRSSSRKDVSDTASRRLMIVADSIMERQTLNSGSFATALTRNSTFATESISLELRIPGAWPRSTISGPQRRSSSRHLLDKSLDISNMLQTASNMNLCSRCADMNLECHGESEVPCQECNLANKKCSIVERIMEEQLEPIPYTRQFARIASLNDVPQNQRLMNEFLKKSRLENSQSFAAGDIGYGERLSTIKSEDEDHCTNSSVKLLSQAQSGSSAAKRMFFELRHIRTGKVPFVSAAPVGDHLDKVLASIEGPPETPYEGGVFWITVRISEKHPSLPPLMRFHTKIYHPNISPQGHICADFGEKWSEVFSDGSMQTTVTDQSSLWYHGKSSKTQWTLGALLTALCGLLATPDVDDPLVPEIAQKYLEDYGGYCDSARLYTQKYATGDRPDADALVFLDDEPSHTVSSESLTDSDHINTYFDKNLTNSPWSDSTGGSRGIRHDYDDRHPDSLHSTDSDSLKSKDSVSLLRHQQMIYASLGVCALDSEIQRMPLKRILDRWRVRGGLKIIIFGDKTVYRKEVKDWPKCDFLLSFYSDGFPTEKAAEYIKFRNPVCLNDITLQEPLRDRRTCLRILDCIGVPTPERLEVNRDGGPFVKTPELAQHLVDISGLHLPSKPSVNTSPTVELLHNGDTLSVNGVWLTKPFVEKSINGQDHDIWIYFPRYSGGGCIKIRRPYAVWERDTSREFDCAIPRAISQPASSFIYEKYLGPEAFESIEVYAAGSKSHVATKTHTTIGNKYRFTNTEANDLYTLFKTFDLLSKSPTPQHPTSLSVDEKDMVRDIGNNLGQQIFGLNLLRTKEKTYVIDINGWNIFTEMDHEQFENILDGPFANLEINGRGTEPPDMASIVNYWSYLRRQDSG